LSLFLNIELRPSSPSLLCRPPFLFSIRVNFPQSKYLPFFSAGEATFPPIPKKTFKLSFVPHDSERSFFHGSLFSLLSPHYCFFRLGSVGFPPPPHRDRRSDTHPEFIYPSPPTNGKPQGRCQCRHLLFPRHPSLPQLSLGGRQPFVSLPFPLL